MFLQETKIELWEAPEPDISRDVVLVKEKARRWVLLDLYPKVGKVEGCHFVSGL
jgi:hypothetical protein